jgi:dynein assembly factor 5
MPDFLDWQRYIGGTLDSKDRASRIRALNLLKDKLTLAPGSLDIGDHSITYSLIEALANRVVNDPAERCRELSLTIINECLCDMDPEKIVMTARCIVPAAAERFGSQPFKEPVEELRLKLIEICTKILLQAAPELSYECSHPITDILTFSLIFALTDTFPAGKRAAAMAISNLCRIAPWSINLHFVALIIELSTNLSHQHVGHAK